ncbi:MAG TPA: YetF domain-containing protein [Thermomicrobiales bacterium]|nr:YetF domain-containing protein [Thermomicrobiales bacterium]
MDFGTMWHDMFSLGVPVLEKVFRPVIVYVFLVAALRLAGKRELAQLNPLDLVVLLTLSNAVQNAIIGNDNSVTGGILGAVALLTANAIASNGFYHHPWLDRVVGGTPTTLVEDGKILRDNLARELITEDELIAVCRKQGVERLSEVETAILETSGTISVFTRQPTLEERIAEQIDRRLDAIEAILRETKPSTAPPPA